MGAPIVMAAVLPRLQAAAAASPSTVISLGARLRAAGQVVGEGVNGVIEWAKANPTMSSLLVSTASSLGLMLFTDEDNLPEEQRDVLMKVAVGDLTAGQAMRIFESGSVSESLSVGLADKEDDLAIAAELLSFAKSHYGSVNRAIRAHALHQAFFEMSRADVEKGFKYLSV